MLSNYNIQKAISNIVIVINDLKYVYFLCFSVSTRVNRVTMNHYKQYHSTEISSVRLLKGGNRKLAKNGVKSFFISVY